MSRRGRRKARRDLPWVHTPRKGPQQPMICSAGPTGELGPVSGPTLLLLLVLAYLSYGHFRPFLLLFMIKTYLNNENSRKRELLGCCGFQMELESQVGLGLTLLPPLFLKYFHEVFSPHQNGDFITLLDSSCTSIPSCVYLHVILEVVVSLLDTYSHPDTQIQPLHCTWQISTQSIWSLIWINDENQVHENKSSWFFRICPKKHKSNLIPVSDLCTFVCS